MKQAITRLVVLIILLANQALVTIGWEPLPFDEEAIYDAVSTVATVAATIWVWWKNNNLTKEAQETQRELDRKKDVKKRLK